MSSLFGAFLFLVLIVITLMIYIYVAILVVRYTLFVFRYINPKVRNLIIIMFFLVTLFKETIFTAVGIVWFVIWMIYILIKNRKSPKGWFINGVKDIFIPPKSMFIVGMKRTVMLFFVGLLMINSAFWIKERYKWVNDKHAYLDAKEYYAVGNVLLFYRALAATALSPENNLLRPLEWIERAIVAKGTSLIPKSDAEPAMWKYRFFWYLYVRNMHIPRQAPNPLGIIVTTVVPLKPWIAQMWDEIYRGLDDLANKQMRDKVFKNDKYLAYPPLAMYYEEGNIGAHYSIDYNDEGSLYNFVKYKEAIKPLINVVNWLEKTQSQWKEHPEIQKKIHSKPRIEIAQQASILLMLAEILDNKMYQGTFRCNDLLLSKVYVYSKAFNAKDAPLTKVPKEEQFIYTVANRQLSMVSYSTYKLCGYERLKGDDHWDLGIESCKDSPLDGKDLDFFKLYYYAKRGIEQKNKQKKQTQGE
jgi:hypothetical protein